MIQLSIRDTFGLGYKPVPEGVGEIKETSGRGFVTYYYWMYTFNDPKYSPQWSHKVFPTKEEAQITLDHFKRTGMINKIDGSTFHWHDLQKQIKELKGVQVNRQERISKLNKLKGTKMIKLSIRDLIEIELGCANSNTLGSGKGELVLKKWRAFNKLNGNIIKIKDPEESFHEEFYKEGSVFCATIDETLDMINKLKIFGITLDIIHIGFNQYSIDTFIKLVQTKKKDLINKLKELK
jgi:hypothetical protein